MLKQLVILMTCSCAALLNAQSAPSPKFQNRTDRGFVSASKFANLPLSFERLGASEFVARGQGYSVDVKGTRATIAVPRSSKVGMEFVNGRQATAVAEKELPGKVNYILGNNPRKWQLGLSTYERVRYPGIYPGVDVVYYGNQKQLEFDLVLKPGADVKSVRMRFSGPGETHIDPSGSLMLGDLRLKVPTVVQGKTTIPARYKLLAPDEVAFEVGAYDRRRPLTIDPTLVYSTRFGGGNNSNQGNAIALDASGSTYVAGYTNADDFPVINSAFAGYSASEDGFISKLNSDGSALIYSTYIGGSGLDYLSGIAVDATGAAWAVGYTTSLDFPLLTPYQNTSGGGNDAVVVKLSPGGSVTYSSFLGGPGSDLGNSVAVDPSGNAFVTGYAQAGFPTTAGVYQPVIQGGAAGFVTKFNRNGSLAWSTFVGGTTFDYAYGIAVDEFGNSYVTGSAYSASFPNAPSGGAQPSNRGNGDAFVAKLNFNGSALLYFTFLGGSGTDQANAIGVDPVSGVAVIAGFTLSTDLSTTPGAVQATNGGGYDGFVAKLNAAGTSFLYATYLGGSRNDFINALAVDSTGNAYLAGYTHSTNLPTNSAIQPAIQGNSTSLFRTLDTGASWTAFDTNVPGMVLSISPDPLNVSTIVVSTEAGIYRTTNGGGTWTQQSSSLRSLWLARSPANPSIIYGSSGEVIFESIDNGLSWNFTGNLTQCCVPSANIVADPINAAAVYVFNSFNNSIPAVQKTVDNGATWHPATNGLPANSIVIAMAAGSNGNLYAGLSNSGLSPGGLYKSTDQGATWTAANIGIPATALSFPVVVVASTNPSIVYATDFFTLYISTNAGATWSTVGPLPGGTSALAISSTSPSILFYAAYDSPSQMWVSSNSGGTWSQGTGIGVGNPTRIVPDPANGAGAYAVASVSWVPSVAKLDGTGQTLIYSTYLGDYGAAYGIATNGTGDAFVAGSTWELPTTPSALQRNRNINQNNLDGFVARISDTTAACSYSVDPPDVLEPWYPQLVHYVVTVPSGCSWTATSNQPWATIASGASGTGSGIVYMLLGDDETPGTRSATLSIGGQNVTLRQRPGSCGYNTFSPDTSVVAGGGGTVTFNVIAGVGCDWSTTNNDPNGVTTSSGASGTGNGTVTLTVDQNFGPDSRTFVIGSPQGGSETISQAGTTAPAVVSTITSAPSGASITVIGGGCIPGTYTTPASLTWNANTNCTINFTTPQNIAGSPSTFYSATVNGGPNTTTNPLTVNSGISPPTINGNFLAPCTYSLVPAGQSFGVQGGLSSFTVNSASTCSWVPVSNATWITIMPSGSNGTAKVNYAVAGNSSAARTGIISAGRQNYNIDQAAFSCSYSINPSVGAFGNTGGTSRVVVTAPAGCAWTATSNAGWLTLSLTSGTGSNAVVVTAAANTGAARSGTVTIAGQTFSATQSATQGVNACGALDVTSQATPSFGPFSPPDIANLSFQTVSITNQSGTVVRGPLYLVLIGQPTHYGDSRDTRLEMAMGTTTCFSALGDYLIPLSTYGLSGDLQPGQSVKFSLGWVVVFNFPSYSYKVLSGTPSH